MRREEKDSTGGKGAKGDSKGGKGYNGGKSDRKRWSNDGGSYDNDWNSSVWKEMWCTVCEYWGMTTNASKHEKETCRLQGGGMEGCSLEDCMHEQRRRLAHYHDNKRKEQNQQWHAQGAAASVEEATEEKEETKEEKSEEEENNAITDR